VKGNKVKRGIVEGQYLVKLHEHLPLQVLSNRAATWGLDVKSRFHRGFAARLTARAIRNLHEDPTVELVEPDQIAGPEEVSNKVIFPEKGRSWLKPTVQDLDQTSPEGRLWGLDRSDQTSARMSGKYRYFQTGEGVTVYVLDTGIDIEHPDFEGRAYHAHNVTASPQGDAYGHGTHCAGTIGGKIHGIAKKVRLANVKVLSDNGSGTYSGIISAIDWVIKMVQTTPHPAVINMSLGGGRSQILNDAVERAVKAGIPVVVAAGNEATDAGYSSPASAPLAITVAASTIRDYHAKFSNYGPYIDLYAPGVDILSVLPKGQTDSWSGTSMAAPHVAGVAALLRQKYPTWSPIEVTAYLLKTARKNRVKNAPPLTVADILAKVDL
jgi:subtilisin family serine protease